MPPFLLRWLCLLALRTATVAALTFALASSIIQMRLDTATRTEDDSGSAQYADSACGLRPGGAVPAHPTGPFFSFLHGVFVCVLLCVLIVSELPLPPVLSKRTVRVQTLLERSIPQLSHKWTSTTWLGLGMCVLASDLNSRAVAPLERIGGWMLLVTGLVNVAMSLLLRKRNIKHLRSLDLRKAALAAASSNSSVEVVREKLRRYGLDEGMGQATDRMDQYLAEKQRIGRTDDAGPKHNPPMQQSAAPTTARFSRSFWRPHKRRPSDHAGETAVNDRPRKPATPIYDSFHRLPDPTTGAHFNDPFPKARSRASSIRIRIPDSSAFQRRVSRSSLASPRIDAPQPATPSVAERSPGLVAQWRAAALEARRKASSARARRSLQIVKNVGKRRSDGASTTGTERPVGRGMGRGTHLRYRSTSDESFASHGHESERGPVRAAPKRGGDLVVQQLLPKAAPRHETRQQTARLAEQRKRRPSATPYPPPAPSGRRRRANSQLEIAPDPVFQDENGASFQLVTCASTRQQQTVVADDVAALKSPPKYSYL